MLTVSEALQQNVLKEAVVVAGHEGLQRIVSWVHTVGVPDAARWLNGGEMVLTTVINMPEAPSARKQYLLDMVEKGVSGLVITVGQMLDHVPDYMREVADTYDFPLIEIPYDVRFVDIARVINERIAQENMALVERALSIQKALTQLVLEGGGIKQLAATLAELIHQSISIENERFEAFASVNIGQVDEARRYTQQYGRTDPRLVNALEDAVLPEIRRTLRPVFIPQMPHVGLEMERILAPIVVHGQIYGYVWIIADDRPVSALDHLAIESGATIAALMVLYQESIQSAEASLKGNLLTQLVQGEFNGSAVLTDQALRFGVDLRESFRVMVVESPQAGAQQLLQLYRMVNRLIAGSGYAAIAGQFAGNVVIVIQNTEDISAVAQQIYDTLSSVGLPLRIGVSAAHASTAQTALAYDQGCEALTITHKLSQSAPVAYFDDLGYLHTLYYAGAKALEGSPYRVALHQLRSDNHADLFHTLETYLDVGGNGVLTAEMLHIHRSTLNYRLQRIAEVCHADLSDPVQRMNLQIALKLIRLFDTT